MKKGPVELESDEEEGESESNVINGQKSHNVSVTDSPPAKGIEKKLNDSEKKSC